MELQTSYPELWISNLLSWIVFIPMIGMGVILCLPKHSIETVKKVALIATFIPLVLATYLYFGAFDKGTAALQLIERFSWRLAPPLAAMLCVGTVGELMGYWFGPGESATAKTTYEFERRKMVQPEVIAQEKIRPRTTRLE